MEIKKFRLLHIRGGHKMDTAGAPYTRNIYLGSEQCCYRTRDLLRADMVLAYVAF